jgi:hypothetical protein
VSLSLLPSGRLLYRPRSVCKDLLPAMQEHREELVGSASTRRHSLTADEAMRLPSPFASAGMYVFARLDLLGDVVCLASDNAELDTDELRHFQGRVVYRMKEIRRLLAILLAGAETSEQGTSSRADVEAVLLIHDVKKVFGGEMVLE